MYTCKPVYVTVRVNNKYLVIKVYKNNKINTKIKTISSVVGKHNVHNLKITL